MGTNLLLEGDDLEALLIRAHAEGGVNARIVRAEKVRQGGFMGFFAREKFEVAVEIPDGAGAAAAGAGPGAAAAVPGRPALGAAGTPSATFARAGQEPTMTQPTDRRATPDGAEPRATSTAARPGTSSSTAAEDALVAELSRLLSEQAPAPAQLAADGLLGLADRVSAAERAAAASAAHATTRSLVGAGAPATTDLTTTDLTTTDLTTGTVAPDDLGLRVQAGGLQAPRLVLPDGRIVAGAPAAPGSPVLSGAAAATTRPAVTEPARPDGGPARDGAGPGRVVPHEPPASPVRPSTARPEFTALLDQLRSGTLPPRPRAAADLLLGQPAGTHPDPSGLEQPGPHQPGRDQPVPGGTTEPESGWQARARRTYSGPEQPAPAPAQHATAPHATAPHATAPQARSAAYPPVLAERTRAALADAADQRALAADQRAHAAEQAAERQQHEQRLTGDRRTLRALGVPAAWTRRMRGGDRFAGVLRMLERMPDVDIDPDVEVVALVGPRGVVQLEAHRTALDLPLEDRPRPVVVVPRENRSRGPAIAKAHKLGTVVVAIETAGYDCDDAVLETLQALGAGAVIAVVDADRPTEESQRWLDALGQVDAIAVDNATAVGDPASVLQLGLPVVRLDGIPVDRVTWSALLCAQLEAADPAH